MRRKHYIIEGEGEDLVYYQVTRRALVDLAIEDAQYGYDAIFQSPTRRLPTGLRLEGRRVLLSKPGVDFVHRDHLLGVVFFWLQWALGPRRFKEMVADGRLGKIMADRASHLSNHNPRQHDRR